jgi:hypothetical protein
MERKKVAFCFSGQARTLELCYPYIKENLFDPLGKNGKDYDVFCCVEDDEDAKKISLLKPIRSLKITSKNLDEEYKDLFKLNYKKLFSRGNMRKELNQLNKIYQSNKLRKDYQKEKKISYDWVFRARFDILPLKKINYPSLNKKYLYTPRATEIKYPTYNDTMALGSEKNLDIYSSLLTNFRPTYKTFFSNNFKTSLKISFFFEKIYLSLFETLIKLSNNGGAPRKFFEKMIMIRGNFFLRPPQENCWVLENALFRHLKNKKVQNKVLEMDYGLVRKLWTDSGIILDKQSGS